MRLLTPKLSKPDPLLIHQAAIQDVKKYFEALVDNIDQKDKNLTFLKKFVETPNSYLYVSRMADHRIVWANNYVLESFGNVIGEICYNVFQNLLEPCDFCTDPYIEQTEGKEYVWVYHNKMVDRVFFITDVMHTIEGEKFRFEKAVDITEYMDDILIIAKTYRNANRGNSGKAE